MSHFFKNTIIKMGLVYYFFTSLSHGIHLLIAKDKLPHPQYYMYMALVSEEYFCVSYILPS